MTVLTHLRARHEFMTCLRRDIHAHPELAFQETRTACVVADFLRTLGLDDVHEGWAGTGVVGVLHGALGAGAAIGLRADMDALPVDEKNTFEHHSRHQGKMHACGHDGHTTMLLAAADYLAQARQFAGTVYFIFQPAEESYGGARVMLEEGLLERFPIKAVFGLHNWPGLPVGSLAVHSGPVMAGSDEFEIVVRGRGGHGAMPHLSVDPVAVGAALVQSLQTVVSRNTDPLDSAVLSITQFHAGHATNVIPDEAVLKGTVRSFQPRVQQATVAAMERVCQGVGAAYGAQVVLSYKYGYPPTINTPAEAEQCRQVASHVLGAEQVRSDLPPSMGAEDFAYFLQQRPGCYVWLGNGPAEGGCLLHNPHYDFNDELIPLGASYWVGLVTQLLAP